MKKHHKRLQNTTDWLYQLFANIPAILWMLHYLFFFLGGVCSVTVIVEGNGIDELSSYQIH